MINLCKFCNKEFTPKYKTQIFCSLLCSNRCNLNKKNIVTLPPQKSIELAELFGILLGDGSVTKYYSKVYLNAKLEMEYVAFVKKLAKKLFKGVPVTHTKREKDSTIGIQISSIDVCDYLKNIGFNGKKREIPLWITENTDYAKATIRGLFDTEGSVGIKFFRGKRGNYFYKQLTVTNKNKNILQFLEKYLIKLGYKPTKNSRKNIYISNGKDIKKYFLEIGSHNPKMINKIKKEKIKEFQYGGLRRMARHQS